MMIIEKIEQDGNTNKEERSKGEGKEKRKQVEPLQSLPSYTVVLTYHIQIQMRTSSL